MTRAIIIRTWVLILSLIASVALGNVVLAQSDGTSGATPESTPIAASGIDGATAWLVSQQTEDGAFPGFSGEADPGTTIDAIFALVAAQNAGIDTTASVAKAVEYLSSSDIALVYTQTGVGQAAKLALALTTIGMDPHNIANVDPLAILGFGQNPETGLYDADPNDHSLAILALVASGEEVPANAITALEAIQADNGGWGYEGTADDAAADSNTTSLVIQALAASGQPDLGMIETGLEFLATTLREGGGAAYNADPASLADSNSTALVIQAVIATGGDPASADWLDLNSALLGFQNADGSLFYQAGFADPNLFSTAQGIPAMAGLTLPIVPSVPFEATPVGLLSPWALQRAA